MIRSYGAVLTPRRLTVGIELGGRYDAALVVRPLPGLALFVRLGEPDCRDCDWPADAGRHLRAADCARCPDPAEHHAYRPRPLWARWRSTFEPLP